jgi:hypothetical protein
VSNINFRGDMAFDGNSRKNKIFQNNNSIHGVVGKIRKKSKSVLADETAVCHDDTRQNCTVIVPAMVENAPR